MKFELGQTVELVQTGELGEVVGRQEHIDAPPTYLVRCVPAGGGMERDRWLEEHQITAA